MKKIIVSVAALLSVGFASAQTYIDDALDMSIENNEGSARYRAMGGSMGALGSDISASVNSNPAAGALSVRTEASATLGVNAYKWDDGVNSDQNSRFNFNQLGGTLVIETDKQKWKRFAITAGYNRINDAKREIVVSQLPETFVYQDYYEYAESGSSSSTSYLGDFLYDGEYAKIKGYSDKFALNFAANYADRLYFGAGLNFYGSQKDMYQIVYRSNQSEAMANPYENFQSQTSTGFSMSFGVIGKITEQLRAGISYQTPTWWYTEEEFVSREQLFNTDGTVNQTNYPIDYFENYNIRTPGKLTGSLGLVLGKNLALNADVIYKDYSNIDFDGTPGGSTDYVTNNNVEKLLRSTMEYRAGAEYRIEDFKLRAGYKYREDPYKALDTNASTFSVGLGYNFGKFYLDGSYDYTDGTTVYYQANGAFKDNADPLASPVKHDINRGNYLVTFGYKF